MTRPGRASRSRFHKAYTAKASTHARQWYREGTTTIYTVRATRCINHEQAFGGIVLLAREDHRCASYELRLRENPTPIAKKPRPLNPLRLSSLLATTHGTLTRQTLVESVRQLQDAKEIPFDTPDTRICRNLLVLHETEEQGYISELPSEARANLKRSR